MLNGLGLCSGILGADLALRDWVRFVCHVEIDPFCQEVARSRFADGSLPTAPIWDDLRTFDGRPWRGCVDLIAAGFPCQDLSVAGRQAGLGGERSGLFFEVVRVVDEVRPAFVLLENVGGVRGHLGRIASALATLRYDARWGFVSAAEVGAWHRRDRWFCLATNADSRRRIERGKQPLGDAEGRDSRSARSDANADGGRGRNEQGGGQQEGSARSGRRSPQLRGEVFQP